MKKSKASVLSIMLCAVMALTMVFAVSPMAANATDGKVLIDLNDVKISRSAAKMIKGQKLNLYLWYDKRGNENDGAPLNETIKFKSSNKKVASVSKKGVVKAKKKGKATITATFKGKKYKCKVRVYKSLSKAKRQKMAKAEAKKIVKKCTNKKMSKKEKATRLALWVNINLYPQHNQSTKAYKKNYGNEAYSAMVMNLSACSGYCKAYKMLCKKAGIPCKHVNAGKWTHQYNKVKIGGKWYKVDTQSGEIGWLKDYSDEKINKMARDVVDKGYWGPIYNKIKSGMYI